jgi:hypothetical protein
MGDDLNGRRPFFVWKEQGKGMTDSENALAVSPGILGSASFKGLRAYCVGYAVDTEHSSGVVYLSLIGYRAAVRAVWAALLDGDAIEIGRQEFRRLDGAYVTRTVRLPENGADHLVMLHQQAALPNLAVGQEFYVLNDVGKVPPYERFLAMLDHATAAPLLPQWARLLWENGRRNKLIEPLDAARGVKCWWVSADDEMWLALIQKGLARKKLSLSPTARAETPDALDAFRMQEHSDESAPDVAETDDVPKNEEQT